MKRNKKTVQCPKTVVDFVGAIEQVTQAHTTTKMIRALIDTVPDRNSTAAEQAIEECYKEVGNQEAILREGLIKMLRVNAKIHEEIAEMEGK